MRNATKFDANITIGYVPDQDDLNQLKQLGYRTLVDVREREEKFSGLVEKRAIDEGFRYISIPISRDHMTIEAVLDFYRVVYDKSHAPLYVFSRFGKKPLAFLVLMEVVANDEPLARVFQRAGRMGVDLRGDMCLQGFLVEFFNTGNRDEVIRAVAQLRPELVRTKSDKPAAGQRTREVPWWPSRYAGREDRERLIGQRGCSIWLTGLPSAGKTTTALMLENALLERGRLAYVVDSDSVRHGLNSDLGFAVGERTENIRRIAHVAKLLADAGVIVVTSFISPFRKERDFARNLHRVAGLGFVEVFVDTPLEVCELRDSRELYKRAREGEILGFTGIDSPYEPPLEPAIVVRPATHTPEEIAQQIVAHLLSVGYLDAGPSAGLGAAHFTAAK
jgi:adenylylsulfate kinase